MLLQQYLPLVDQPLKKVICPLLHWPRPPFSQAWRCQIPFTDILSLQDKSGPLHPRTSICALFTPQLFAPWPPHPGICQKGFKTILGRSPLLNFHVAYTCAISGSSIHRRPWSLCTLFHLMCPPWSSWILCLLLLSSLTVALLHWVGIRLCYVPHHPSSLNRLMWGSLWWWMGHCLAEPCVCCQCKDG